jgi:hypothetical protein
MTPAPIDATAAVAMPGKRSVVGAGETTGSLGCMAIVIVISVPQ